MSGDVGSFLVEHDSGDVVSLGGLDLEFKVRGHRTDGQLSIAGAVLGPRRLVPPHLHANEDEYSYVVEGTIGVRVGDEEFEAGPGSYLIKPRGLPHAFWNPTDEVVRTVEVVAPSGFEGFFEGLAAAFATGDPRVIEQRRAELGNTYDLEYLPQWVPDLKARYGLKVIGE